MMLINYLAIITLFTLIKTYQILNAITCGHTEKTITKFIQYEKDQFFDSKSFKHLKQSLPSLILNTDDKALLLTSRIGSPIGKKKNDKYHPIQYKIPIQKNGHYILVLKFIEIDYKQKGRRVFNLKIGDELIFTVDIYSQVGPQKILNKWIEFDLENEVIYLNKTYPALNAYYFNTKSVQITIQGIKGVPKIQSFFFIYGEDGKQFLHKYLDFQQSKSKISKQYTSQKYRNPPKNKYKILEGNQKFDIEKQDFYFYLRKIFSFRSLISLIGVSIILFNQIVMEKLSTILNKSGIKNKKE